MKNIHLSRLLCCMLCALLCCGMLWGLSVSAAAAETTEHYFVDAESGKTYVGLETAAEEEPVEVPSMPQKPVQARSIDMNENGDTTFTTFEELKQLATDDSVGMWYLCYEGDGPLTIEEDLSLDMVARLLVDEQELIIPEGVTLTIPNYQEMYFGKITVAGVLENYGYLTIFEELNVTGTLKNGQQLVVDTMADLTGNENIISVGNDWAGYFRSADITSGAQLKAVAQAAAAEEDSRWEYDIHIFEEVTLEESVTIPENAYLYVNTYLEDSEGFVVANGATLTMKGILHVDGYMTVYGTLHNEAAVTINGYLDQLLNVTSGGSYTGGGKIELWGCTAADVEKHLPWLDLDQYYITGEYENIVLYNTANMTQLGTPTDLQWGYVTEWQWDEEAQEGKEVPIERPGGMMWKPALPDQADARICIYDAETDELVKEGWWGFDPFEIPEYRGIDEFITSDLGSGTYYFTVQSRGDGIEYYDSEVAKSDNWTYVQPAAKLGQCANLTVNGLKITWDKPEDETYLGGYFVEYYFTPSLDQEPRNLGGSWWWHADGNSDMLEDHWIMEHGAGYYGFKVRALSADITASQNGDWSEMSELVYLDDVIGDTDNILTDIVIGSGDMTEEEIRDNVQALDTEELKYALLSDTNDQGATADLAALEAAVGGPAGVAVSEEVTAFNSDLVSIVGANLNTNSSESDPITLVIDKPEREDVIPDLYNSSIAVSFSMTLDNVEDTQNLEVPVKIRMPIPSTINPNFLVILHYHADGSMEEVWPVISYEGRQGYASFVLTSFSDFVFTEYQLFDIAFANMTLGNSLAMNFAFRQDAVQDWTGCYATIIKEYADGRPAKVLEIPYEQWGQANIGGVAHYTLKFPGVAAKEMSDSVIVYVSNADGVDISRAWMDSVRDYATRTLENPASTLETKVMVVDLLNYGAAAQKFFKYNTSDLANSLLTAEQKALATKEAHATNIRATSENYQGTNLGLESQILMRMAFKGVTEDMYAKIHFYNHAGREITVDVPADEIIDGIVVIDEIVIADGRMPVTVTVYNADGSVYAYATDSMESYIARMREDAEDPLYEAILKFSDSAYYFFHH